MATHSSILTRRTPWTVWKGKRYDNRNELAWLEGVQYATGEERRNSFKKSKEAQSEHDSKLRMCLLVKVKSDAIKNYIALKNK